MNREKIEINKENNRKIYPLYKMFSWDLLFYTAIIFIYLVTVKDFSLTQIFLLDSIYMGFKFIMQFPAVIIVDKLR